MKNLSDELYDEFDRNSKNYWLSDGDSLKEIIAEINEVFLENQDEIIRLGKFEGGYRIGKKYDTLIILVDKIKSDPFIPQSIREIVVDLLENRANVIFQAYITAIDKYRKGLAKGKYLENIYENYNWIHNQINDTLYSQGCGISQIEEEVHKVRLSIQKYFQRYNPIKSRRLL